MKVAWLWSSIIVVCMVLCNGACNMYLSAKIKNNKITQLFFRLSWALLMLWLLLLFLVNTYLYDTPGGLCWVGGGGWDGMYTYLPVQLRLRLCYGWAKVATMMIRNPTIAWEVDLWKVKKSWEIPKKFLCRA